MAGALLGGVVHTIVAPIERTKLLLQTPESNMTIIGGRHTRFNGMVDCFIRTVRVEGLLSLWRGSLQKYVEECPTSRRQSSSRFSIKFPGRFSSRLYNTYHHLSTRHCTRLSGCRYWQDLRAGNLRGMCHFLKTIHGKDGIRGIYRGLPASLQGMAVQTFILEDSTLLKR